MTPEELKKLIKKFLYFCYGFMLFANVSVICLVHSFIPDYSMINFSSISSKTLQLKCMECYMFTSRPYPIVLHSQMLLLLVIIFGTPIAVQVYILELRQSNRLNRRRLNTFYLMFSLWLIISPVYSVLYYYALKGAERCMLINKTNEYLHYYYKQMYTFTYVLMVLNASGFLLLLNSVYFSLVKYVLSHVVVRRLIEIGHLNVIMLTKLPQFAFFLITRELMILAFNSIYEFPV